MIVVSDNFSVAKDVFYSGLELNISLPAGENKKIFLDQHAKIPSVAPVEDMAYTLKYSGNCKIMEFKTVPENADYKVVWVSDMSIEEITNNLRKTYISLRNRHKNYATPPEENILFFVKENGSENNEKEFPMRIGEIYDDYEFSVVVSLCQEGNIEFLNEFFEAELKDVRLRNGKHGTKITLFSGYDLLPLPSLVYTTRADRHSGSKTTILQENGDINLLVRTLLEKYIDPDTITSIDF